MTKKRKARAARRARHPDPCMALDLVILLFPATELWKLTCGQCLGQAAVAKGGNRASENRSWVPPIVSTSTTRHPLLKLTIRDVEQIQGHD
ncbi:hypothetical protein S40285_10322 [Stachybotrys chlorohalonatus IBT 40285]|uniref:Uncharacterized protein n=1 Tax=Stachybotrys chlorohalonatus (strain IBT 40285) TaxID=1283841 RepID=A0A084QFI5_STAC4|nr:hypothetical protein S40285_10322 [Stachybotrys chlorohalonata IBT 40285]